MLSKQKATMGQRQPGQAHGTTNESLNRGHGRYKGKGPVRWPGGGGKLSPTSCPSPMERSCTYARGRWRDDSIRQKRHGKIGEKMGHACRRRGMEPLGAGVVDLTHVGVRRGSDGCGRVEYAARVKGRRQPVSQLTRRAWCVMGALPLGSANRRGE
jgi:hypothetical protein